ncbi:uncharacterized protein MYCGRDRAFT_95526 [Zymoseptoria tritici IPO323]|uniref:Uncharacterized protein n=1 Tax=Zymoseptoria tritici (strain CBS 115943 / IPO323) TaxID=336722 RepID=F9XIZ4_ZYMTI|nr:uncharacterized protein MYCGRDRAFT_95526 [Zymoseptoria tritici IPO323]EGP84261.1 hypothetical protein MYCGRDRAFT_95526 [Zymoseptoria tritici IPO323]
MHTWLLSNLSPASISILYMSICTVVSCMVTVVLAISFHWAASEPVSNNDHVHFILSVGPSVRFGFRWGWYFHTAFSWIYVVFVTFTMTAETHALINFMKANTAWIAACFVVGCAWVFAARRQRRSTPSAAFQTILDAERPVPTLIPTSANTHSAFSTRKSKK